MKRNSAKRWLAFTVTILGCLTLSAAGPHTLRPEKEFGTNCGKGLHAGIRAEIVRRDPPYTQPPFVMVSFILLNDGETPINSTEDGWAIVIDGKDLSDSGFIFGNGPGPTGGWGTLNPGESYELGKGLEISRYFPEAREYTLSWKGHGFQSSTIKVNLTAQTKSSGGSIDGTVTYGDGRLVKGATVYAEPLGRAMGAVVPHADTDESGYFLIHIPRSWFGKFAVAAKKEDEDYPDMSKQFYSDGKFETVTLTSRRSAAKVKIQLGPKAGFLLGKVRDADAGARLRPCVEFKRTAKPNNYLSGSGLVKSNYRLLVPSDADILMKIWLDGYKPWYYPGTTDTVARRAVRLSPGQEETVGILLEPDPKAVESGCGMPIDQEVQ